MLLTRCPCTSYLMPHGMHASINAVLNVVNPLCREGASAQPGAAGKNVTDSDLHAASAAASASASAVASALSQNNAQAAASAFATTQDTARAQVSAVAEAYAAGKPCLTISLMQLSNLDSAWGALLSAPSRYGQCHLD